MLENLGVTGVYLIFLISAQNTDCGYSLELHRRGGSNEYLQSMFWVEIWKTSEFFIWNFQFWVVKFSVYLNWHVFVMCSKADGVKWTLVMQKRLYGTYADSEGQDQLMSAFRFIGYYRMIPWRENARIKVYACAGWCESAHFTHSRKHFFASRHPHENANNTVCPCWGTDHPKE